MYKNTTYSSFIKNSLTQNQYNNKLTCKKCTYIKLSSIVLPSMSDSDSVAKKATKTFTLTDFQKVGIFFIYRIGTPNY